MGKFKVGDRVKFNYGYFPVEKTGIVMGSATDQANGRRYCLIKFDKSEILDYSGKNSQYFFEDQVVLLDERKEEEKELKRLEHISEDPFGEEIW